MCIALYRALPLYMKQVNTQWAPVKNYVYTETSFLLPDFIGNLFLVSQCCQGIEQMLSVYTCFTEAFHSI